MTYCLIPDVAILKTWIDSPTRYPHSDVPVTVRGSVSKTALRGKLNGGGAVLKLRSSGGGIKIESN